MQRVGTQKNTPLTSFQNLFSEYITTSLKVTDMARKLGDTFQYLHEEIVNYSSQDIELIGRALCAFRLAQKIPSDIQIIIQDPEELREIIKDKTHLEEALDKIVCKVPTTKKLTELTHEDFISIFNIIHDFYRIPKKSKMKETFSEILEAFRWTSLNYSELEKLNSRILQNENKLSDDHKKNLTHYFGILMQRPMKIKMIFDGLQKISQGQGKLHEHLAALNLKMEGYINQNQKLIAQCDHLPPEKRHKTNNNMQAIHQTVEGDLDSTISLKRPKPRPTLKGVNPDYHSRRSPVNSLEGHSPAKREKFNPVVQELKKRNKGKEIVHEEDRNIKSILVTTEASSMTLNPSVDQEMDEIQVSITTEEKIERTPEELGFLTIQKTLQKEFNNAAEPGTYRDEDGILMVTDIFLLGTSIYLDRYENVSCFSYLVNFFLPDRSKSRIEHFQNLFANAIQPVDKLFIAYTMISKIDVPQLEQTILNEFQLLLGNQFSLSDLKDGLHKMIITRMNVDEAYLERTVNRIAKPVDSQVSQHSGALLR